MSITRAEISLGEDLAGLFEDALRVLAMALVWDFVAEDEVCRGLSLPQWPWEHGDSLTVELRHREAQEELTKKPGSYRAN